VECEEPVTRSSKKRKNTKYLEEDEKNDKGKQNGLKNGKEKTKKERSKKF